MSGYKPHSGRFRESVRAARSDRDRAILARGGIALTVRAEYPDAKLRKAGRDDL